MVPRCVLFVLLCFAVQTASAQPRGYAEVPHRGLLVSETRGCPLESGLYDQEKLEAAAAGRPNCAYLATLHAYHKEESLAYYEAGGDCHMRLRVKVFRVDREKKYKLIVNKMYGGCRAGGWRSGWITFERMPAGYHLDVQKVTADTRARGENDGLFLFPKAPSKITREKIGPVALVDLKGCLPLTGQSRWVLDREDHLANAVGSGSDAVRCREVLKSLSVDFSRYTLVGYSFASGHCARPPGLVFDLVRETSTDPAENRYVLTARYDKADENSCKVWTAWPQWMLVPKMPVGFKFDFDAKPL